MIQEIRLPDIEENVDSGVVSAILVSEGDSIGPDDPVIEMETDKAAVEIPAGAEGTVKEIVVNEGDEISIGDVILKLEGTEDTGGEEGTTKDTKEEEETTKDTKEEEETTKDTKGDKGAEDSKEKETSKDTKGDKGAEDSEEDKGTKKKAEVSEKKQDTEKEEDKGEKDWEKESHPVPAAPSVRRLAREIGVNISKVEGTGPGGRISDNDVKAAAKSRLERGGGGAGAGTQAPLPDFSQWGEVHREQMSRVRQITAESTAAGWNSIPHVTQFDKADVTDLEEFRQQYKKTAEKEGVKLTVTALLVKVLGFALEHFPRFNSSLDMNAGEIIYKDFINIGVAVDTERGLLVPVVKNVESKSILEIAGELGDLAKRARSKKISPDEMKGGSFIISNLGGIGGTQFTPLIYPPQVAILGVSRAATEPVWKDGEFVPRQILPLSLSYDHRVIDGADGARFLRWVCGVLEHPLSAFMEGREK